MKAMILAAGEGRRLRPLTKTVPKALVDVGGVPMLERVLRRLIAAGVDGVIVNVFHLPDPIEAFLKSNKNFGVRLEISREETLLDTGGGLKKASWFFDDGKPFFLHNVDALTEIDLGRMRREHAASGALATLAVADRPTSRRLLFDPAGNLCGREVAAEGGANGPAPGARRLAFNGVHVISPEIFPEMTETGVFSILAPYLRLSGLGRKIRAFRADEYYWADVGSPEKLEAARRRAAEGGLPA